MTSKKTAASKRATLPRAADYAKSFPKDWERLSRSGRYDMNRLKAAMLALIANDGPLDQEWLDHPLGSGDHYIRLAYKLADSGKTGWVVFVRVGTHAELFE